MSGNDFNWETWKRDKFPSLLGAAQHQDRINSWPWYGKLIRRIFISWRCPACKYWGEKK